jgi:hypothetical protein
MLESELSECIREVMQLMSSVLLDLVKIGGGNLQAAQRARVGTIKLSKLTKRFRTLSVEGVQEVKSNRELVRLGKHIPVKRLNREAARQKKIDARIVIREAKREAKRELQIIKKRNRIDKLSIMLAKLQEGL